MAVDIEKLVVQMSADIKGFEREMRKAQGVTERRASAIEKRFQLMNKRVSAALGTSLTVGGVAGVFGIALGASDFVETTKRLDSLRQSFKAITGDEAAAAREMDFISQTAEKLGLELLSTGEAYASLMAATKGTNLEGQATRDIFIAVANAMGTLGKSSADTEAALLAVQQMVSKGKVSAEELRGQLGERLPGAFQAAADALGITTAALDKMLQKGQITADDLLPRLAERLTELYAVGRKDTLSAEINRLNNAVTELYRTLADTGSIGLVTSALKQMAAVVKEISVYADLLGNGRVGEALALNNDAAGRMKLRLGIGNTMDDAQSGAWDKAFGFTGDGSPTKVTVNPKSRPKFVPGDGDAERLNAYQRLTASVRERTGAIQAETAAQASLNPLINDYGFAVEKARAQYDLLQAAQDAGLKITPALAAQIDTLATSYAAASAEAGKLQEQQQELIARVDDYKASFRDALGGFVDDMKSGVDGTEALINAVSRLSASLLDMALDAAVQQLFKGLTGSLFAGSGFSGGGIGHMAKGGVVRAATGGTIRGPGSGTSDSIPTMLSNGEYVVKASAARKNYDLLDALNNGNIRRMATGGRVGSSGFRPAGGRSAPAMTVTYAPQVSIGAGASVEAVAELRRVLDDDRRQFASRTLKTLQDARRRNVSI